jgi:outer membrane protein assembly factor BamD
MVGLIKTKLEFYSLMKIFIFGIALIFLSCSIERPTGSSEAEILYKEAISFKNDGHYLAAIEKLNQIRSKHPYSYFAIHAELLNADILFLQENFVEAAAAYLLFKNVHPKYDNLPYVVYKIAESYYYQLPPTFDRDLSGADEAIKFYKDLIENYPDSVFVNEAKDKIKECYSLLARKEQYIADFYYKTGEYSAARYRYFEILKDPLIEFPLREHSMINIVKSSWFLKEFEACIEHGRDFLDLLTEDNKKKMINLIKRCEKKKMEIKI